MGRGQKKGVQQPTQCTDRDAGRIYDKHTLLTGMYTVHIVSDLLPLITGCLLSSIIILLYIQSSISALR